MSVALPHPAHPEARAEDAGLPDARLHFRLPAADTSAAEARRRTRRQLAAWGAPQEISDDAQLIISELVANALRHTGSTSVGCELRIRGSLLCVAVTSDGAGPSLVPGQAALEEESGRGLFLVCTLAQRWGVHPCARGGGHVVWADLTLTGGGPLPCQREGS